MKYFGLLLIFAFSVQAQDLNFEDLENAPAPSAVFDQDDFENLDVIDALTEQREAVEKARVRVLRPPPIPKAESRPDAFRAVIPQGTVVTRLSDDKDFVLSRRIQVWAQEVYPGSQVTHLLDKEKQPAYSARSILVVPIEADLALNPKINPKITYDKTAGLRYTAFEQKLSISTDIAWEFESIAPNFWNQIFEEDLENAKADRLSSKIFYKGNFLPINFGLGISYQDATAASDTFEIRWTGLFIGPQISYNLWTGESWNLDLEAGASTALISTARTSGEKYSPSSYEWGGAAKLGFKTWAGTILTGLEYRRSYISLDKATSETNLVTQKESQSSVAFLVGYRFGFNL